MANDSALEQRIQIQLGSNKAIIIVKTILGDYCKKKKKKKMIIDIGVIMIGIFRGDSRLISWVMGSYHYLP